MSTYTKHPFETADRFKVYGVTPSELRLLVGYGLSTAVHLATACAVLVGCVVADIAGPWHRVPSTPMGAVAAIVLVCAAALGPASKQDKLIRRILQER